MIGTVLAGRYRITGRLGSGGMGAVWRAEHTTLGTPVAVKLIDDAIAQNTEVLARFAREAQAAATLRSPHIVHILDYGVDEGRPYIAMELLDGESLEQRLERAGRLSAAETVSIFTQIGRAMGKAHDASIVHRDLKPANIFLVPDEGGVLVKILDFGIAKTEARGATATRTGTIMGTPAYMSPEQARDSKQIDHRTDLWSLAVIAFECLTGRRVYLDESLGDLIVKICTMPAPVPSEVASVPAGFDAWFARGTQKSPADRFASAKELASELESALSGAGATLTPEPGGSSVAKSSGAKSSAATSPAATSPAAPSKSRVEMESGATLQAPAEGGTIASGVASSSLELRSPAGRARVVAFAAIGAIALLGVLALALRREPESSVTVVTVEPLGAPGLQASSASAAASSASPVVEPASAPTGGPIGSSTSSPTAPDSTNLAVSAEPPTSPDALAPSKAGGSKASSRPAKPAPPPNDPAPPAPAKPKAKAAANSDDRLGI